MRRVRDSIKQYSNACVVGPDAIDNKTKNNNNIVVAKWNNNSRVTQREYVRRREGRSADFTPGLARRHENVIKSAVPRVICYRPRPRRRRRCGSAGFSFNRSVDTTIPLNVAHVRRTHFHITRGVRHVSCTRRREILNNRFFLSYFFFFCFLSRAEYYHGKS